MKLPQKAAADPADHGDCFAVADRLVAGTVGAFAARLAAPGDQGVVVGHALEAFALAWSGAPNPGVRENMWCASRVWCVIACLEGVSEFTSQRAVANIDTVYEERLAFNIKSAVLGGERCRPLDRAAQTVPAKCRYPTEHIDSRPFVTLAARASVLA